MYVHAVLVHVIVVIIIILNYHLTSRKREFMTPREYYFNFSVVVKGWVWLYLSHYSCKGGITGRSLLKGAKFTQSFGQKITKHEVND